MSEFFHRPLIIDVAGTALTDDDRRRLTHPLVGGVILPLIARARVARGRPPQ